MKKQLEYSDNEMLKNIVVKVPKFTTKEELEHIIEHQEDVLRDLHDTIKMFIWSTEHSRIKPSEMNVVQWVDNNIEYLIGKQNMLGKTEVLLDYLRRIYEDWELCDDVVVSGFINSAIEEPSRDSTKEYLEDFLESQPKDSLKTVLKETSKETSKDSSKTAPNETSEETFKETSKETSKDSSKTLPKETSEETSKKTKK